MTDMIGLLSSDRIKKAKLPRVSSHIIHEYKNLPDMASIVARAMDQMGISSTIPSEKLNLLKSGGMVVGQAITIRNIPEREVPFVKWQKEDLTRLGEREAYFLAQHGDVIVIDGISVYPSSCLGSMSTKLAKVLGISGIIVYGCVTGLAGIKAVDLPVWALGGTTITGHQRVDTIEINGSLGIMGTRIEPGDLIVADEAGISVVPLSLSEQILKQAKYLAGTGVKIRNLLESGGSNNDIKRELYNQMQNLGQFKKSDK